MIHYVLRRLLYAVPVIFGISLIVFFSIHLIPGDAARAYLGLYATEEEVEQLRHQLGLDRPVYEQYLLYLGRLLRGDLGKSISTGNSVASEIITRLPATMELAFSSILVAIVLGISTGVVGGIRRGSWIDTLLVSGHLFGMAMPVFWTGLMLILIFSERLGWLPSGGRGGLQYLIMPALTLGIWGGASIGRITRATVLEIVDQNFVRTAWAKGLSERLVVARHILKNAMLEVVTIIGLQVSAFLSGTVVTETVFSFPGLGRMMVNSIRNRDIPVVQGGVLVIATIFVLTNLLVDILYAYLDPRIRYE